MVVTPVILQREPGIAPDSAERALKVKAVLADAHSLRPARLATRTRDLNALLGVQEREQAIQSLRVCSDRFVAEFLELQVSLNIATNDEWLRKYRELARLHFPQILHLSLLEF